MGPAYYVIAILGCADGGAACTPVATVPVRYEDAAACSAASMSALESHTDLDFPTLVAECREAVMPIASSDEQPVKVPAGALQG